MKFEAKYCFRHITSIVAHGFGGGDGVVWGALLRVRILIGSVAIHLGYLVLNLGNLLLLVQVTHTFPVLRCQILHAVHVLLQEDQRAVEWLQHKCTVEVSLSIDPIAVYVAIHALLEHVVEISLALLLPLDAVQVVVQLVHVADPAELLDQCVDILVLVVHMADESTIWRVILRLLLVFKRLARVHIETVDFFCLAFGLLHADLIDFSAEAFTARGKLLEEVARE